MSSIEVYSYHQTTYFSNGLDQTCCTMRLTFNSRSCTVRILKIDCLLDGAVDTSEAEFACDSVHVRRECDKVFEVDIIGAWNTRTMDTVLGIPF